MVEKALCAYLLERDDVIATFEMCDCHEQLPSAVMATPDPEELSDTDLLLITSICTQKLAQRHGAERALELVSDSMFGRLPDGDEFDLCYTDFEDEV